MMKRNKYSSILFIAIILFIMIIGYYIFQIEKPEQTTIKLFGNVDIRDVQLSFRVGGKIKAMRFDEGDNVKKGYVLSTLDDKPYLYDLQAGIGKITSLGALLENAKLKKYRMYDLLKKNLGSKSDYDDAYTNLQDLQGQLELSIANLQQTQRQLDDTTLLSPADGVIISRVYEPGSIVQAGDVVYILSLSSPIWIRSYISESLLGKIYPGMPATIVTDAKHQYEGKVGFISPIAEFTPKTVETADLRTDLVYRFRVIVKNPDRYLRQNMPVTVYLHQEILKNGNE